MPHWFWTNYFKFLSNFSDTAASQAADSRPSGLFGQMKYYLFSAEGIQEAIKWGGTAVLFAIVFVETGLLLGFFLPGDSLLVTAGFLAADPANGLHIGLLFVLLTIAAIAGDAVGFWIGSKAGPALFKKDDSILFKRKHLLAAHAFYEKYGGKTIVIARFVPIIRTFAPTVAGAAQMQYRKFVIYNIIGGVAWVGSMLVAGWSVRKFLEKILGQDQVLKYLHYIIIIVIILSILPGVIEIYREKKRAKREGS
ncbi:MAG: VTT domain-containing protein [Planctomycetota bacterium]